MYGAGGDMFLERPCFFIRYRQLPNISLIFLFLAVVATGFVGFKFFGWLGVIGLPVATALLGCQLAALLLMRRRSRASIYYYSNPFTQLVVLIPLFSVLAVLLPRGTSGAVSQFVHPDHASLLRSNVLQAAHIQAHDCP